MQKFRNNIQIKIRLGTPADSPRGVETGRDGSVGNHQPDKLWEYCNRDNLKIK